MSKYRTLYLWMIIPMVLMQLGIARDYWGDFTENTWAVHVHYWCATLWYAFLVVQPWLATHGRMELHRTNGMIGLFLAGGVAIGALSMMHRDLVYVQLATEDPVRFGPFTPDFFYGVAVVEILMVMLFSLAVVMAIVRRKQIEEHAWWLVSTVFIIMMPALGRGIQGVFIMAQADHWPDVEIFAANVLSQAIIIAVTLAFAWKYGKLKHPATWCAVAINLIAVAVFQIGSVSWIQVLLSSVIKG
ncbi:MAG: hypothetical protein CMP07_11170 [Xanthomonadales bacterium]|nr:hypothetical protein [Xanthomonadales bacterium]|tara:strand:- start:981 stop:1712 length:732 start_codon:yes stop_codon:yes gene_type:complete